MKKKSKQFPQFDVHSPKSFFLLLGLAAIVLIGICVGVGWWWGHSSEDNSNPYQVLKGYEGSRHAFLVKSAELSVKMADRAIEDLKQKKILQAVDECKTAIDLFPLDTKPYILLTKLYLMTGQEIKMYDTLTQAGRSYPNFNNIVSVIDDNDLDQLPSDVPKDNVYVANFPEDQQAAISYMFDDGEANVYKALPIFEKYGYRATIPVVAAFVSDTSNDPFWGSWTEWRDAAKRGFEIANHSMYHRDEKSLNAEQLDVAINQSKEVIERNTGVHVMSYAFPHDSYTDQAVSMVLKEHRAVRTPEFLQSVYQRTVNIVLGGPYVSLETANRLVDIGIKRHLWIIAKCHGVTDKRTMRSFKSITPNFLDGNLNYLHSKAGEVWVDTFINVFNYLQEKASSVIETKSITPNSIEFILRLQQEPIKFVPLTVIIKLPNSTKTIMAKTADGHSLKAWSCEAQKACIDVDQADQLIRVSFS